MRAGNGRKRGKAGRRSSERGSRRAYVPGVQRRRQILEVAAKLFSARGYAGTTTKRIAEGAGVSETVLFRHFPTKERLYAAILEHLIPGRGVESWLHELREIAGRRDDEGLFAAVAGAIATSYRRDVVTHRLMLFAALESHELAGIFLKKYTAPVAAFLCEYVALRQSEGAFRPAPPEVVAHMLLSGAAHLGQWRALGVDPLRLSERDVVAHARLLLDGVRVLR